MDFYIDLGFAVLLRILKDRRETSKWRRAFLKLFDAIARAYAQDAEFVAMMDQLPKKGG